MKKRQERIIADLWATASRLESLCSFGTDPGADPTINQVIRAARNVQRVQRDLQRMTALLRIIWKEPARDGSRAADPDKAADPVDILRKQIYQWAIFPGGVYSSTLSELAERHHGINVLRDGDNLFFLADLFALGVIHGKRLERARRKKAVRM